MEFHALLDFIRTRMRMAHIYQPVMIRTLLDHRGEADDEHIAKDLLSHDRSQIEYYQQITRNMVGRVLRGHDVVEREGRKYLLVGFDKFTPAQIETLREACDEKLSEYISNRGNFIWSHRRKSAGYISGTLKFEVLKAAKFRCELCGISADEVGLEVDHIIPRNKGGTDDLSNLQALCYSHYAMKQDRDDTDFRAVRESYSVRKPGCIFCELPPERIIAQNELAVVIHDGFPVTPLHSLIIPKRHVSDFFELGVSEMKACIFLLQRAKTATVLEDREVVGFNVGVNVGEVAGQTIMHCHLHLMPRRRRDTENPRGGVRGVIPGKMAY